jgi:hypothetical protein
MKPRLMAYVALASLATGAAAISSKMALAQGGRGSQGQQSEQDRGGRGGQLSEQIDKALQAYQERMDKNLDQCRKELGQMKKELHELIDLRIDMALSLAELRARAQMQGGGFAGAPYASFRPAAEAEGYRPIAEGGRGGGHRLVDAEGLKRELEQLHGQLRSEIDQQQREIAQLAAQLRGLQQQGQLGQHPGPGLGQEQGQSQGGPRGQGEGRRGPQGQPDQPGQPGHRPQAGR